MFELGWRTLSVGFLLIFSLYRKRLSCSREKYQKEDKDCAKKLRKIPRSPIEKQSRYVPKEVYRNGGNEMLYSPPSKSCLYRPSEADDT